MNYLLDINIIIDYFNEGLNCKMSKVSILTKMNSYNY